MAFTGANIHLDINQATPDSDRYGTSRISRALTGRCGLPFWRRRRKIPGSCGSCRGCSKIRPRLPRCSVTIRFLRNRRITFALCFTTIVFPAVKKKAPPVRGGCGNQREFIIPPPLSGHEPLQESPETCPHLGQPRRGFRGFKSPSLHTQISGIRYLQRIGRKNPHTRGFFEFG